MKSVRSLTLALLATAALGFGSLQVAQAQGTNQGSSAQGQAAKQAQSQASPQGQATSGKQSGANSQQGAANSMSGRGQQAAGGNMSRSMQMGRAGGSNTAVGGRSTTVTTQRNGRSYALYGQPQSRTTIIRTIFTPCDGTTLSGRTPPAWCGRGSVPRKAGPNSPGTPDIASGFRG